MQKYYLHSKNIYYSVVKLMGERTIMSTPWKDEAPVTIAEDLESSLTELKKKGISPDVIELPPRTIKKEKMIEREYKEPERLKR